MRAEPTARRAEESRVGVRRPCGPSWHARAWRSGPPHSQKTSVAGISVSPEALSGTRNGSAAQHPSAQHPSFGGWDSVPRLLPLSPELSPPRTTPSPSPGTRPGLGMWHATRQHCGEPRASRASRNSTTRQRAPMIARPGCRGETPSSRLGHEGAILRHTAGSGARNDVRRLASHDRSGAGASCAGSRPLVFRDTS